MVETAKDNLKDYLIPYGEEEIQLIRDKKMQLVTRDEFLQVHQQRLIAEREDDNKNTLINLQFEEIKKIQKQLNTAKKALTEIRANIEEHNQIYDLSTDTALLLEGIDGIALAAIGGDDESLDN